MHVSPFVVSTPNMKAQIDSIAAAVKSAKKGSTVLVVGHSNTIPVLANLLVKKELFKNLDDSEYGTIWVMKMKDGKLLETKILQY